MDDDRDFDSIAEAADDLRTARKLDQYDGRSLVHFDMLPGEDVPACGESDPRWLSTSPEDVTCPDCKDWLR